MNPISDEPPLVDPPPPSPPLSTGSPASSTSPAGVDSPLSSYYLHHTDNTGLVLVTQLLTEDNYISWSRSMLIALSVKNKLGFIEGSITRPTGELLPAWIHNDHVVIAWILNSVSKKISSSILFSESTWDIWIDLKEHFEKSNGLWIFQLKRDLATLSQNQQSVSLYFTKLKTVWDELSQYRPSCSCSCSCGGAKSATNFLQCEYLMNFLMGLNESYANIHAQLPLINKAFSLVNQEEPQRSLGVSSVAAQAPSIALAVQHSSGNSKNVPKPHSTSKNRKERPFCTHCGLLGHTLISATRSTGIPRILHF